MEFCRNPHELERSSKEFFLTHKDADSDDSKEKEQAGQSLKPPANSLKQGATTAYDQ
jgi:hypothetical protein